MKKYFLSIFYIIMSICLIVVSGCSGKSETAIQPDESGKITVYTSFYTMYDFARKIGGERINLINLVPSGTEPHDWEPKAKDISRLEKADVFIYNGAGMEIWVDKVLNTLKNEKLVVVEASKDIKLIKGSHDHEKENDNKKDEHDKLEYDPHVWLNPMFAKKQMEAIKNAFVSIDPNNRDYYESNYTDNAKRLDELDKEYKDAVSGFTHRDIIVAHEAFGYLCDAYGLKQVAIEGLNAETEPTAARMAEIAKFAKHNKVKVIFFEELVSPKVANVIAKEIGAETDMLNPLEGISEEGLKAGKEYFTVMKDNLAALKRALQ